MGREPFMPVAALVLARFETERHGQLCMHHDPPERTCSVEVHPQPSNRAARSVVRSRLNGVTTRQLPCRFMVSGVNRRNSMAVEFGL